MLSNAARTQVGKLGEGVLREDIKAVFEEAGCVVDFVEFNRGNEIGFVRLSPDSEFKATAAAAKMTEAKCTIKDAVPELTVLEGEEETEYWNKLFELQKAKKEGNKGRGGGRGGGRGACTLLASLLPLSCPSLASLSPFYFLSLPSLLPLSCLWWRAWWWSWCVFCSYHVNLLKRSFVAYQFHRGLCFVGSADVLWRLDLVTPL
jgi:hypothetical protein